MQATPSKNEPTKASPAESQDPLVLPTELPAPEDDGAAAHLFGMVMPPLALRATDDSWFPVNRPPAGFERLVLYAYPRTGQPGAPPLTADWDMIPGARGCTPEACGFRDHAADLAASGASVAGVSTQDSDYQREAVDRLRLTFPLLSDAGLELARALRLPIFTACGEVLFKRLTLVVRAGAIETVFYPVFPPDRHASDVLEWLRAHVASPD